MSSELQKRVRKRSKRFSESDHNVEEPPKKKFKRSMKQQDGSGGRGGKAGVAAKTRLVGKGEKEHHKPRRLMVSLNFVQNGLKINSIPPAETKGDSTVRTEESMNGSNNGANGEGTFPRRSVELNFKDPNFSFSYLASNKKKTWKNLKQIIALERSLLTRPDDPTYSSIDAPPPLKPAKKYADMSGLTAKYTDPLTGIFFNTSEEFHLIRSLPSDIVQGYLALRGKLTI